MSDRPVRDLALYVHIPFCSSRCRYCDFYFETGHSPRVMRATLERIIEESEQYLESLAPVHVSTVYFGGGTPSVIPPEMLATFLARFRSLWNICEVEWTFEANPESVSQELLDVLAAYGISRLSIGVQSFQDPLLSLLGRRATRSIAVDALSLAASNRATIPNLNVDLITGIPGQTVPALKEDIDTAASFEPDHFSLYSLTIEERTPFAQMIRSGSLAPAQADEQDELWFFARDEIEHRGFTWYEISNFASAPSAESLHNRRYWNLEPYLGLGPGAVSTIPADRGACRLRNPNLFLYGVRDHPIQREEEPLSARDLLFEHFITGLRTRDGVDLDRIAVMFGEATVSGLGPLLSGWRDSGVAEPRAEKVILSREHRVRLDRYLLELKDEIDALPEPGGTGWPCPPPCRK